MMIVIIKSRFSFLEIELHESFIKNRAASGLKMLLITTTTTTKTTKMMIINCRFSLVEVLAFFLGCVYSSYVGSLSWKTHFQERIKGKEIKANALMMYD